MNLPELRAQLLERDGENCGFCRLPLADGPIDVDHVVQRAAGGSDELPNLRLAHRRCNRIAGGKSVWNYRRRPAAEPIVRLLVRLPDDLHAELVNVADEDTRSLNNEILVLLREALDARAARPQEQQA